MKKKYFFFSKHDETMTDTISDGRKKKTNGLTFFSALLPIDEKGAELK